MNQIASLFNQGNNELSKGNILKAINFYEKVLSELGYEMHRQNSFDFHGQGLDTIEKPFYNSIIPNDSEDWDLKENVSISYHPKRLSLDNGIWSTGINEDILVTGNGSVKFSKDWKHNWVQI